MASQGAAVVGLQVDLQLQYGALSFIISYRIVSKLKIITSRTYYSLALILPKDPALPVTNNQRTPAITTPSYRLQHDPKFNISLPTTITPTFQPSRVP